MYQEHSVYRYDLDFPQKITKTSVSLVQEIPLTIYVGEKKLATTYCSPAFIPELTVGFLASQGLISQKSALLDYQEQENQAWVKLTPPSQAALPSFKTKFSLPLSLQLIEELNQKSSLFKLTGGVHTAGLMLGSELLISYEDISRHNAVNKALGYLILNQLDPTACGLLVTSRVSTEMMEQIAPLGIPLIVSRSAPSQAAVNLADRLQITLVGFARGTKCNIYTHPNRFPDLEKEG